MLSDRFIVDVFPILSQAGAGSSAATGAPVQEQTEIQWLASPIATSTQQSEVVNANSNCTDIPNEAEDEGHEGGLCGGSEMEIASWRRLFCGQVEAETTVRLKTLVILRQNYHHVWSSETVGVNVSGCTPE